MIPRRLAAAAAATLAAVMLAGCSPAPLSDADVASQNLATAAEQFQILRRVVFLNGITDTYLLSIEGFCSVDNLGVQLQVTCKIGDQYKKHMLGLSQNVSYFVEQLDAAKVSTSQYKVIFKPSVIVPDVAVS